ncbi:MAG: hypothetical protein FWH42_03085 [Dehalococcoidia bacterium]|nr:hypothetical protein [Dehalococcoidia bacterium]
MSMQQYYRKVQDKVMVQRDVINALLKDPRIIGDYYEAIVRDAVREAVPASFAIGRGVVLDGDGSASKECDIIIYNNVEYGPLFKSADIVVVSPEAVRCVIQVKGTVNQENLGEAIHSLAMIDQLRQGIWKFIVGFKTNVEYQTLVEVCAQSKCINGIYVFSSSYKQEKEDISLQMQKFMGVLKSITAPQMYQTNDAGKYLTLEISGRDSFHGVPFPD